MNDRSKSEQNRSTKPFAYYSVPEQEDLVEMQRLSGLRVWGLDCAGEEIDFDISVSHVGAGEFD